MAYQVLARKWRPKNFADLVGQEHVVKALRNALEKGRLHHAYLLTGTRGVGKTTIARILAKSLNCEHAHGGEPCGQCQSCVQIDGGRYVDLLEIDAASNTGIDNIREVLENAQYAPTAGKYKVYIIDEVHMLSKSAFNAMLKTLEEPPEHVKFILATTDPHKVPITVLSRCLQFVLRNMTPQQVAAHLAYVLQQEHIAYEETALHILGRAAMGSMRDALSLLDQAIAMGSGSVTETDVRQMIGAVDKHYLYDLLNGLIAQDGKMLLDTATQMAARAVGFDHALSELALLLQRVALVQSVPNAVPVDDPEYVALLQAAQYLNGEQIQLYYQCAIHGKKDLVLAPDEYAGFVMTLLRMLSFTPMAAAGQPVNGSIEGTALHNPDTEVQAAKKFSPIRLPETPPPVKQAPEPVAPEHSSEAETLPPASATAETANFSETVAAETVLPENVQAATAISENIGDTPPESVAQHTAAEMLNASETVQPEKIQTADMAENDGDMLPEAASETAEPMLFADVPPWEASDDDEDAPFAGNIDFYALPEIPVAAAHETADAMPDGASENLSESAETATLPQETADDGDGPLPEWAAENWCAIMDRLAKRLGAAHMLAQHMAWVDFEPQSQRLSVALDTGNRVTANRSYFERIRQTLSQEYGLANLNLHTCDWQDDWHWETPQMQKARRQQENQAQAQAVLEADAGCRALMAALDADGWKPHTLTLFAES